MRRTLAVLRFQTIAPPASESWISPNVLSVDRLDAMMRGLHREGRWKAIAAEELVAALEDPRELPERALFLTFDGACRSVLDLALDVLRRYRFPAATFVSTDFVGQRVTFDGVDDPVTVCTWEELRVLHRHEVSVQSLGLGRRRFSRLDPAQQEREAVESRDAIRAHVGVPASIFAYPHGEPGREPAVTTGIVREAGYKAALTLGGGVVDLPASDPFRLSRIAVGPETDLAAVLP